MSMTETTQTRTVITLITAPGCHFCEEAHAVLTARAEQDRSLDLEVVDALSLLGSALIGQHRPAMNPLVLIDGAYFSSGRLPRRKLEALLACRRDRAARSNRG